MPKLAAVTTVVEPEWRNWSADESKRQPKRTCSVAGCKDSPARVKELPSSRGGTGIRKYVYCKPHAKQQEA